MTFSFFLILFSSFGKHLSLLNSVFGYLCHILRCLLKHFAEMKSFGHTLFWHLNFIVRILFVFLILSSLHSVFLKLIANITCFLLFYYMVQLLQFFSNSVTNIYDNLISLFSTPVPTGCKMKGWYSWLQDCWKCNSLLLEAKEEPKFLLGTFSKLNYDIAYKLYRIFHSLIFVGYSVIDTLSDKGDNKRIIDIVFLPFNLVSALVY